MDGFDEIINDYITTHKKNFELYFINCEHRIEFDKDFTTNIEINYRYNIDTKNIKSY